MRNNVLWKRVTGVLLSCALVFAPFNAAPSPYLYADKGEGTVTAKYTYDESYDNEYAYSGNDLGCSYTPESTTFKVWSPKAEKAVLCRYTAGNGGSLIEEVAMSRGDKGVWSATIQGDIVNTYYTYKITVDGTTNEAVDIYAKAAGVNGDRGMVVDLDSTDPDNWDKNYKREATLLSDIIVWEVHIRDFSIDVSSGVSTKNRGKYKAFTESTTVNGEGKIASCVDYLKQLGVTHVQLMPMYDYASVDETKTSTSLSDNYNWGYDPENYNVPEGSYSSNPYDGNVRITEMKEMIQALHDAGIKVIMDVVYNHTYDTADSNFNKIMPDYYYKINSDMTYNDQTGCGNATRSTSAMFRKFMVDSVTYWADEYNIDGFRFDLMGVHDYTTMNLIRSTLDEKFGEDTIVMYGEGWTAADYDSDSAHKANESKLDDGIGYFNDQIRDAIKGEHKFDGTIGLVQTNYTTGTYLEEGEKWPNNVFGGIMGSVGYTSGTYGMWRPFWSKSSNCSLSYTSAHDNLTLWDKLTEKFGKNYSSADDKLLRMNKMAGSVILVSKGGTFMQAGEEFARTKNGDDNSYKSSDSVNKIDWTRVSSYSAIQKYYEGMIKIRKAFSGFRSITTRSSDNWNPNNNNLTWISKDVTSLTGFYETNDTAGEWNRIAVLINNATSSQTVSLTGSDSWVIIADGTTAGLTKLKETGSSVSVDGKSVVIAVPKDTFDACNISENNSPVIQANSEYSGFAGSNVTFTITATDADGDDVTLAASGLPTGATFSAADGVFSWKNAEAGTYTISVSASDAKVTVSKTITLTISEKSDALKNLISIANTRLSDAGNNPDNYDAEAVSDLKEVLSSAETFIKTDHESALYSDMYDDLNYAIKACKSNSKETVVRVKAASWTSPAVYIWSGSGSSVTKYAGDWPGTKLTDTDSEGWYVFELPEGTSNYSLIVNDGNPDTSTQTSDIENISGNIDVNVTSFTGKTCTYEKTVYDIDDSDDSIDKSLLSSILETASQTISEHPANSNTAALKTIYEEGASVYKSSTATQVEVNRIVRSIRAAIYAVTKEGETTETSSSDETSERVTETDSSDETSERVTETDSSDETSERVTETDSSDKPSERVTETDSSDKPSERVTETDSSDKPSERVTETDSSDKPSERVTETDSSDEPSGKTTEKPSSDETSETTDEISENELRITGLSADIASGFAYTKNNVRLSAKASGGTGKLKYRFCVKVSGSATQVIKNYSSSKYANWKPSQSGTYEISVYVRDSKGEIAKKSIAGYKVNKALKVTNFKTNIKSKTTKTGKKIRLSMRASGGTGNYKYKFAYKKSGSGKLVTIKKYSYKSYCYWKPSKPGRYTLYSYVKDTKTSDISGKSIGIIKVGKKAR